MCFMIAKIYKANNDKSERKKKEAVYDALTFCKTEKIRL